MEQYVHFLTIYCPFTVNLECIPSFNGTDRIYQAFIKKTPDNEPFINKIGVTTMKILAFAASNSKKSINKSLVQSALNQLNNSTATTIDINDFEMPIYGEDLEQAHGVPDAAKRFMDSIAEVDALIISLAEHNGSYTVAFKNILDWCSRLDRNIFQNKEILLLATSPGPGGASNVLKFAVNSMPFFGGEVIGEFSLPSFYDNFNVEKMTITDAALDDKFKTTLSMIDR